MSEGPQRRTVWKTAAKAVGAAALAALLGAYRPDLLLPAREDFLLDDPLADEHLGEGADRIALGLGTRGNMTTPGGSGKMYFDDIRLYRPRTAP